MEILALAWRFRSEIGIAILALVVCLIIYDIKHTYTKVDEQSTAIKVLEKGLENAQKAVKLQADIQLADGTIDKKTFKNISTILHRPVPVVLITGGRVFGK